MITLENLLDQLPIQSANSATQSAIVISQYQLPENVSHTQLFSAVANQEWGMWLDSSNADHIDSRYDILVWQPAYTLETYDKLTKVTEKETGEIQQLTEDPLTIAEQLQAQLFDKLQLSQSLQPEYKQPEYKLPFNLGTVGYFAYDLGRRFEKLPSTAKQEISAPDMAVGIYLQALIFDKKQQSYSIICPQSQLEAVKSFLATVVNVTDSSESFSLSSDWQSNMSKAEYGERFKQVQNYLLEGDCYQINLAQGFSAEYSGCEMQAYLTLRQHNQAPFSAFINTGKNKILSISPERFLQLSGGKSLGSRPANKVQTKPIKGTKPRSENAEQDKLNAELLKASTKDRAENLMIVDLLRNDISRVCKAGSVKVPKLFDIESFPAVHHLVSTVEGELAEKYSATDLLRAAFPGGSITGAPKIRAMEIIEELEPQRRSVYCGSIGYISACGKMDTSITIRTLICEDNRIYCWAGGGLVADSKVDSEYQETFDKVRKILPVLQE